MVHRAQLSGAGKRAMVVGCGLGADAEYVAALGFRTTAFDVSESAISIAQTRHPGSQVDYRTADALHLPAEWRRAFDLVVEIYTVQALPLSLRGDIIAAVADLVADGGTLIVIQAARRDIAEPPDGPPWPLHRSEIDRFAAEGLRPVRVELRGGSVVESRRALAGRVHPTNRDRKYNRIVTGFSQR